MQFVLTPEKKTDHTYSPYRQSNFIITTVLTLRVSEATTLLVSLTDKAMVAHMGYKTSISNCLETLHFLLVRQRSQTEPYLSFSMSPLVVLKVTFCKSISIVCLHNLINNKSYYTFKKQQRSLFPF